VTCSSLAVDASIKLTPVYPFALHTFIRFIATTGTSAPAVVYEALLQLTGAPLAALYSMPVCTFRRAVLQTVLPDAGIFNHSRFSSSVASSGLRPPSPKREGQRMKFCMSLSVSPGGFIPDADDTSGNS
jgi:hypothetical protein